MSTTQEGYYDDRDYVYPPPREIGKDSLVDHKVTLGEELRYLLVRIIADDKPF